MKKIIVAAVLATSLAAHALPTYEPFTEFAGIAATNTTPWGTNTIDLATGGYSAPTGELWGNAAYSASVSGNNTGLPGLDILVTNMPPASSPGGTPFSATAVAALLPVTFPGVTGGDITTVLINNSQPGALANTVGNSAVLNFSQDITRPASGTRTLFWSYLFSVAQKGQAGAGNDGRYLGFLASTNLNLGTNNLSYPTWQLFFNKFGNTSGYNTNTCPKYFGNGIYAPSSADVEPVDTSAGLDGSFTSTATTYGGASFIVGEFVFTTNGTATLKDTNILWYNPSTNTFGGATPASGFVATPMNITMSDVGGLVFIDRPGSGASGGVGTNYIANLLIGTTWSYVTGGPEFTNPPASTYTVTSYGQNVSLSGAAVAAAQSVNYQWQRIIAGVTNNLTNGPGTAGGTAVVAGATTTNLTLTGVSAGDLGNYQLLATASSTHYTLTAPTTLLLFVDPHISSTPGNVTTNYGGTAAFTVQAGTANGPLTYGWTKGGAPIANGAQSGGSVATGAAGTTGAGTNFTLTLTLTNVSYADAGYYVLNVTNAASQHNASSAASLTVKDPYIITQLPFSLGMVQGTTNTLSISAAGSGVTYQWFGVNQGQLSNGGNFSGVTTPTLTILNAQYSNADSYYVVVNGNSGAPVTSSQTTVYVSNPQLGPFATTNWPASVSADPTGSQVDYVIFDPTEAGAFVAPYGWQNIMNLAANSGDQTYSTITYAGVQCIEATGTYFNFIDSGAPEYNWHRFTNYQVIDVLLQVWGNSDLYDANGNGLTEKWTLGSGATSAYYVVGGAFPLGANNGQWNWMLLSVTNPVDANGLRSEGDPTGAGPDGGVNGGTMRLEIYAEGLTIAAVAIGPHGAFGTSNQINRFAANANCPAQPTNNLAYVDFNQGITNNLTVLNSGNYSYNLQSGVGPAGDLRTAIQCTSGLMNFAVLSNYLGEACNENLTMQVCLEFYDDPAMAGGQFYPFDYATDAQGDLAYYPYNTSPYTMTGTGQWLKAAFFVGPANLQGINTAPLTGGPEMYFPSAPFIDRVELGVVRTGTNALAGQIPDSNYHVNPLICSTNYGYYAEWNPAGLVTNNLDVASGYNTALVGPANDKRTAEVPISSGGSAYYLQWSLLNQVFGPTLQDNANVFMTVTYYDDPALANNALYPNVYSTLANGSIGLTSPSGAYGAPVLLQGTGKWQTAYWELPNVNFNGGTVCRYAASAPIYVSRVRYDVVRPCGTFEGINYLQTVGASATNGQIKLNWFGQASVVSSPNVTGPYTNVMSVTNLSTNIYTANPTNVSGFFKLQFPSYPPYLSTNTP